jgi:DMSO/TMAO reductase YedYZ heme-binding membrane subunit
MLYILAGVVITIAVVFFIFTGVWGGLIWIVVAGVVVAVLFVMRMRSVPSTATEPTGVTRSQSGSGSANERVGQS